MNVHITRKATVLYWKKSRISLKTIALSQTEKYGGDPTPTLNLHKERQRTTGARTIRTSKSVLAALAIAISALPGPVRLPAQTLARPGWVGSGLTAQTWFKHAILYQIDTRTFSDSNTDGTGDLKGITQHLDYIHSLGVDAILLRPLAPSGGPLNTVDPALGTLDDFDDLTLQASRLKIRILLELPAADPSLARFWLTRGVAGFYVPGNASPNLPAIDAIRKLLPTYVGQRVLITDADIAATSTASKSNELILDRATLNSTPNPVPMLRTALEQSQALIHTATPILAIDRPAAPDPRLARLLATATLLNRSASLITAGQELGFTPASGSTALIPWGQPAAAAVDESPEPAKPPAPVVAAPDKYTPYVPYVRPAVPKKPSPPDPATAAGQEANPNSLLNFYRHLSRLHHGTSALRDGEEIAFNHDDREALIWMRKPASPSQANPPVLVACNFSDKPLVLSLKADVTHIQLHGNFLRTILRSDDLMGGVSLDPLTLPPFGVYIGELRY